MYHNGPVLDQGRLEALRACFEKTTARFTTFKPLLAAIQVL